MGSWTTRWIDRWGPPPFGTPKSQPLAASTPPPTPSPEWKTRAGQWQYLEDLIIEDAGAKDGDAMRVDDGPGTTGQRPCHLLLAV